MKDSEQANHPLRRQLTAFAHFTTRSLGETNIEGEIVVGYREEGAGWRLWVHDNGHGLPSDHESRSGASFGQQLVAALVSRVNAEITYTSHSGTKVDVFCGVTLPTHNLERAAATLVSAV
jgi:hypothetical protein